MATSRSLLSDAAHAPSSHDLEPIHHASINTGPGYSEYEPMSDYEPLTAASDHDRSPINIHHHDDNELVRAEQGEANLRTPLLADKKSTRSKTPVSNCIRSAINPVSSSVWYVATHPISSALALVTAAPTALNALAAPSGMGPDKLGKKWWDGMSTLNQAHSIANGSSSLLINTIMNALFLPTATHKFTSSIMHTLDSLEEFIDNTLSIILTVGSAFASFVIAYNAFLWLPNGEITALIPAVLSSLIASAQRYVGARNAILHIRNVVNANKRKDINTQKTLADMIRHIRPAYRDNIEKLFQTKLSKLLHGRNNLTSFTNHDCGTLLLELAMILDKMEKEHQDLIVETTVWERYSRHAGNLFDLSFALFLIAPTSLLTHMQKGYDGVDIISNLTTGHPLPDMNIVFKWLIGLDSGMASALLYASSALDIRTTLIDAIYQLYQHPIGIPFALILILANVFASGGMQNVAMGVANNPDNIFHLLQGTILTLTFIILMTLGGFVVNTNASVKKSFPFNPKPANETTVADMANFASRPNDFPLLHDTAVNIHNLSLFTRRDKRVLDALDEYSLQPSSSPAFT